MPSFSVQIAMSNLATPEAGASVVLATCSDDDRHPPGCAIDGTPGTCWVTTGMFPQELVVRLGKQTPVSRVKTWRTFRRTFSVWAYSL